MSVIYCFNLIPINIRYDIDQSLRFNFSVANSILNLEIILGFLVSKCLRKLGYPNPRNIISYMGKYFVLLHAVTYKSARRIKGEASLKNIGKIYYLP